MFDVMSQARNAMESYSSKLRAITANISNVQVEGYKRTDVSFQSMFSNLISPGTAAFMGTEGGGTNPLQTGGTVAVADSSIDFTIGQFVDGKQIDAALRIQGAMFMVSPDGGNTVWYTRNGSFKIINDSLVTDNGMQVYGFKMINGVSSQRIEPISLAGTDYGDASLLTWDERGVLRAYYNSETEEYGAELPYQLAYTTFKNPSGLRYENATTFSESLASGQPSDPKAPPNGSVSPRRKEQSNVTYTSEVVDSIEMQRALDAVMTVIKMANDTITAFINKMG